MEGDVFLFALVLFILRFLSTPSGWRATANAYPYLSYFNISIHALRVESDRRSARFPNRSGHFYPRPPGGGRPSVLFTVLRTSLISIHALRVEGDGVTVDANSLSFGISIHALRVEGDLCRP